MRAFNFLEKTTPALAPPGDGGGRRTAVWWKVSVVGAWCWALTYSATVSASTVTTLGGGCLIPYGPFNGDQDGNTVQAAQFNGPCGCAVTPDGATLYVADYYNNKIRKLSLTSGITSTFARGLTQPVAVVVDSVQNLYVANYGDGAILRYDRYGSPPSLVAALNHPTALTLDTNCLYVTEVSGSIKRISFPNNTVTTVASGLGQPKGLALLNSGYLAVSESANHTVRILDPADGRTLQVIGSGPGFCDGLTPWARFNRPEQLAKAPNGSLVIADRGNNRVRYLQQEGYVGTVYGLDASQWGVTVHPYYAGWWDGSSDYAEAREPVGVCVHTDGTVYTTEIYYHLIRKATGTGLSDPSVTTATPVRISPASGYYPTGQALTVLNPNTNIFESVKVYYTTDGSEPTFNSKPLVFANSPGSLGTASLLWNEPTKDLSFLRIKVWVGNRATAVTNGNPIEFNQIGFSSPTLAGIGSRAIIPVVVTLQEAYELRSLQFRVEITPAPGSPSLAATGLKVIDLNQEYSNAVSTVNAPFIAVKDSKGTTTGAAWARISFQEQYSRTNADGRITRGVAMAYLSSQPELLVRSFGTVAMLAVDIPRQAAPGNQYLLEILYPSGTSLNEQDFIPLNSLNNYLLVTNQSYVVGDIGPYRWYQAGQFGNTNLDNSDVRSVFKASLDIQTPFLYSDAFDAMDVFPVDTAYSPGGDSRIRYLDWIYALRRSLRLDLNNWRRMWTAGGTRLAWRTDLVTSPLMPGEKLAASEGPTGWSRQGVLGALSLENVYPGQYVQMPIYVQMKTGCALAGLQFRAVLTPEGSSPPLYQSLQFRSAALPPPELSEANPTSPLNDWLFGWTPSAFSQPLVGSNLLGYLGFTVPYLAQPGDRYTLHFLKVDGAPDLMTQYDLESRPGTAWILGPAATPPAVISDEWKMHFFSSLSNPHANPASDPDGDDEPNLLEYQRGTDPVELRFHGLSVADSQGPNGYRLRWFAKIGWTYEVEYSAAPGPGQWRLLASRTGRGEVIELVDQLPAGQSRFYRLRASAAAAAGNL